MKGFTFPLIFLAILGTAYSNVIKAEDTLENVDPFAIDDCWYDTNPHDPSDTQFMCETGGGVVPDGGGDYSTPELCQAECVSRGAGNVAGGGCSYWAFTHLRNSEKKCYLLDQCYEDVHNHCTPTITADATCASGPRECADDCDPLLYEGGLDKSHWDCIHTGVAVHPYDQTTKIPSGSICTAECPVWKDSGNQPVPSVRAKCKDDGSWEIISTPQPDPAIGTPLADPNPTCACVAIKIDPTTFDTTQNEGAELFCTDENGAGDLMLMKEAFTIEKQRNCIFMCDKQFVLEIACNQGTWTGEIEDCTEFYCWHKPAVDECGGSF